MYDLATQNFISVGVRVWLHWIV